MTYSKIEKYFSSILVLLPALNVYKSFIPSVELGTFLILLCDILFMFGKRKLTHIGVDSWWIALIVLFGVLTIIADMMIGHNSSEEFGIIMRFLKIVIIVLSICIIGKSHVDYARSVKTLEIFALASAVFLFVQYVANFAGLRLMGVYAPLTSAEGYADYDFDTMYSILFRPSAFFFEPSHFATYMSVYLSYLLSHDFISKRRLKLAVCILAILLSTSGTGYVLLLILVIASILFSRFDSNKNKTSSVKYLFYSVIIFTAVYYFMTSTDIGTSSMARLIGEDGGLGASTSGRIESGAADLFAALPESYRWIGCGFGFRPDTVYFPSLYALLYGDGYIGLGLFILLLLAYFVKSTTFGRLLILSYGVLMVGTGVFNFASIGLFFSLICYETNNKKILKYEG